MKCTTKNCANEVGTPLSHTLCWDCQAERIEPAQMVNGDLFPPDPIEHTEPPHVLSKRRLDFNMAQQDVVRGWATKNGIFMRVTNYGHHWHFRRHGGQADWWPSSAKLVLQREYKNVIEVDHHEILIEHLDEHFTSWDENYTEVEVGQVWIDDYHRAPDKVRRLKVMAVDGEHATVSNVQTGKVTLPKLSKFFPTATAYRIEGAL